MTSMTSRPSNTFSAIFQWRSTVTLFILAIFLVGVWSLPSDASDRGPWRILVLQSYHADFTWTADIMQGIHKVFDNDGQNAEFYIEYMDTKRFPKQLDKERLVSLREQLAEKYRTLQPHVIITVDDDALRFLLDCHETIFPQVPIVFCGVNNSVDEGKITARKVITGVMEVLDRKETIDGALAIHPEAKKLAIITDTTTNGIGNRLILKELAKAYAGRIQFIFLDEEGTGITLDVLRSRLSKLDDETIVYYGDFFRDKNGFLDQATIIPILSKESRRPIYSPYSFIFGLGTVGGKLNSALFQGETAAKVAIKILKGVSPSQIPIMKESVNKFMFDFRQMERWNIREDRLPSGSIVMYKHPSFFDEYRQLVISTVIVFVILLSVIVALIVSIHRRKRAEAATKEAHERFLTVLNGLDAIVYVADMETYELLFVNKFVKDMFGDILGQPCWKTIQTGQPGPCAFCTNNKLLDAAGNSTGIYNWEFQNTANGHWYDVRDRALKWADGRMVRMEIATDITERKRAEEALLENEKRYRIIIHTTMDGFWMTDMQGHILDVNEAYCRMSGYSAQELMDMVVSNLEVAETTSDIATRIQKIMEQGEDRFESKHRRKDGSIYDIEVSIKYIPDKGGRIVGFLRDITESKRAEAERISMEKQLFQSQKMEAIGTLAGGIAHDFNNILSVIIGYTELAKDKNQKENKEKYLQEALNGAQRAKNLVKQILTFSRQEDHEKKPLDIKILLKEAVKFLRSSIPTTVEINQQITDEECNIMADPTQMHQVIMNLCTNASHAMKETGGTLKIELANIELTKDEIPNHPTLQPGHYVKLTVSDTGYGIDPDNIQKIFDPFFTTKSVDEGTGLGLSVVYGIVKSHGGVITVYSEQGKGAAFHVYLPRIIHSATMKEDIDKPVIGGTERILFVDDEPALVDIAKSILSSLGYDVTGVLSSVEALNMVIAEPQRFDLVITDMTLPKMTGIDLSWEMLKIRPDIPIILCSGIKEPKTEAQVKTLGIKAYLKKPLTRRELAQAIRDTFDGQKKQAV